MEVGKLNVEYRAETRKSSVRRLRASGKIPAVCYGAGAQPMTLAVDPTALMRALDPHKRTNTVIKLTVTGGPDGQKEVTVMLRDWQKDAIRGDLTHADFIRVALDKEVHVTVPIVLTGKAAGVKEGGILHQVVRLLNVGALPEKIPTQIDVDVSGLTIGHSLHVSDLSLPANIDVLDDAGATVAVVSAPKTATETTTEEAGAAEPELIRKPKAEDEA